MLPIHSINDESFGFILTSSLSVLIVYISAAVSLIIIMIRIVYGLLIVLDT